MNKNLLLFSIITMLSINSCDLLDNLIPDVNTKFTKTFTISVTENSGFTNDETVNIADSEEYNDFKENIKGFEVTKITYEILNADVPDNMYFQGSLKCSEEVSGESATAGTIGRINLSNISDTFTEREYELNTDGINLITGWLSDPGKFKYNAWYTLTNASSNPYVIPENSNYNFKLRIKFYIKVKTGT